MESKELLLSVKELAVSYRTSEEIVRAVNGVSFSVNRKETLGLVGETGAGKTTIAKAIMSILPDPPASVDGGEILFEENDLLHMPEKEIRKIRGKKISMIFQDPMTALNPVFTVGDQIAEGIRIHENVSRKESEERAKAMLEMVGIPSSRYGEYPHQFSGGMKQRVVIAIALSCNPELLIADEPTTALDVTIQAQILHLMKDLKRKYNSAMILITHDLGVVAGFCENVAVVYAGEIIESGPVEEVFTREKNHPYTEGLFNSIPHLDTDAERLIPIDGFMADPTNLPQGCKFADRCPYCMEKCRTDAPPDHVEGRHHIKCFRFAEEGK